MSVIIKDVKKGSICSDKGIKAGDTLIKINGHDIIDILDYQLYVTECVITLLLKSDDKFRFTTIKKQESDDIGLEFETYLMDKHRSCKNKCIFCFIDQMPPNMRESLYFKDDDARLSFLFGNYITLTNIDQNEIDRIIRLKISPINISVHTTNPMLRAIMMNNRFAGDSLKFIGQLTSAGITVNCQLVMCKGVNDGAELENSLNNLLELGENLGSVSCVPVGLTKYREGLYPLEPYDKESAGIVIDIIDDFAKKCINTVGRQIAYASDEFYIIAKRKLPSLEYYGELMQLENGVGMLSLLISEFLEALEEMPFVSKERDVTIATGVDFAPYLKILVDKLQKKCNNLKCKVIPIKNKFFGETITVTGLITASDLIKQLSAVEIGETLLVSECMLSHEQDKFLDDITVGELEQKLDTKLTIVKSNGAELLFSIIGEKIQA